jgi:O-antigen/teichoic acid export membrane protein
VSLPYTPAAQRTVRAITLKRILYKVFVSGGVRFAVAALSVFFSFYVARSYDLATLGAFTLASAIVIGLSLLSRLGFERSILKLAGSLEHRDGRFYGTVQNTLKMTAGLGVLVAIVSYAANLLLGDLNPDTSRYLRLLLLLIPVWSVNLVIAQFLNGIGRPYLAPLYEPAGCLAVLSLVLVLLNRGRAMPMSFDSVVAIYVCLPVAAALIGCVAIGRAGRAAGVERAPLRSTFAEYRAENFDFFISGVAGYVFTLGLFPMVGLFLDNAAVGFFRICERLASTLSFILIIINSVLGPRYALAWRNHKPRQLARLYGGSVVLGLVLAVPVASVLLIFADPLIALVARGDASEQKSVVLRIMVVATFVHVLAGGSQQLLNMAGHHALVRNVSLLMLPLGVGLFAVMSAAYGLEGAALAFLAYIVSSNLLRLVGVWRRVFAPAVDVPAVPLGEGESR